MTIRFSAATVYASGEDVEDKTASSREDSDYAEDDNNFEDWESDEAQNQSCRSLFEDKAFPSATAALSHDKTVHNVDLSSICAKLKLDDHQRIRLINFIRKNTPTPENVGNLTGAESLFSSDEYLIPVIENDPLLQLELEVDDWSDDEDMSSHGRPPVSLTDLPSAVRRVQHLEKKLAQTHQHMAEYRSLIGRKFDAGRLAEIVNEAAPSSTGPNPRDDDTHYFSSYCENDIHAVMIQDKVRTSTYASFILTNPILFRDAVVLDVGCGTGILSLLAAKSGAKHVYAVDASDIVQKAEHIVRDNGLENVITVIHGKVEEITLPDGVEHVDIIISEWMGYALLYESMLDSVLQARDRFLKPEGGVMAPSQCRIMFGLCEGSEILKDRIGFWNDVYGFDLSVMARDVYGEAIVDVVGPDSIASEPYLLKDLHLKCITSRQLDFTSQFTLVSTTPMRTKIHAFVLYFDTFFTTTGEPVLPEVPVKVTKEGDVRLAEVWPVGGKAPPQRRASMGSGLKQKEDKKVTSFSTGPHSQPTHWKQTIFLLKDPIHAEHGTIVTGTFYCKKSDTNSRELDVEIHYSVRQNENATAVGGTVVQLYRVR